MFFKAFYMELFKFPPWNITEHIRTFSAHVHSSITYHRSASGIKGTRHRTSNKCRESTGKLIQQEWTGTRVKWEFTVRPCPQTSTVIHLSLEGHILSHHKLAVLSKHGLPKQPQLLGAFLLFYLYFFSLKKWKQEKSKLPRHARQINSQQHKLYHLVKGMF